MNTLSDNELVALAISDAKTAGAAIQELMARHKGLYINIVSECVARRRNYSRIRKADALGEMPTFFYEAAKSYDPERGMAFPVYLVQKYKWDFGHAHKAPKVELEPVGNMKDLDAFVEAEESDKLDSEHVSAIYKAALDVIDNPRDLKIYKLRFGPEDLTYEEIGEVVGESKQVVEQVVKRWLVRMRAHFKDCNITL